MSTEEFSNEFDSLIQALVHVHDFGTENPLSFDEYEKSVFLTKAQEQLVVLLYSGKSGIGGYEEDEETRRYLFPLVDHREYVPQKSNELTLSEESYVVTLDKDVMFIVHEHAVFDDENLKCLNGSKVPVAPVSHDNFNTMMANPFKCPNKYKVHRIDSNLGQNMIELVSKYNISKYRIRVLLKPTPIVLTDLGDVSIDGVSTKTECLLSPLLHRTILENAVKMALATKATKG